MSRGLGRERRSRSAWRTREARTRARSPPRCPPLPIRAGKERKLPASRGLLCPRLGGGERRAAGPLPARSGGSEEGEGGAAAGETGPSRAERGEGGIGSMAAPSLFVFASPVCRESPFSRRQFLAEERALAPSGCGTPRSAPSGRLAGDLGPTRGCEAGAHPSRSCLEGASGVKSSGHEFLHETPPH